MPVPAHAAVITPDQRCLLAAAAPKELAAVARAFNQDHAAITHHDPITLDDRFDALLTGVGKSCAAASVARVLATNSYASVVSVGVAGALPADNAPAIGDIVAATRSVFSDEGTGTPKGFTPLSAMGFAPFTNNTDAADHDPDLLSLLSAVADHTGPIATVSWCSGTDACARGVVNRTGAIAEAMEGTACALAARRADTQTRTGELRAISNTTGDRDTQTWDLDAALAALTRALSALRTPR